MMNLRKLFRKEKGFPLQVYGKLPFYQDYIAVITTPAAAGFRDFLLGVFGREGITVPGGLWPFVFQAAPGQAVLAGLIRPGTDGMRQFPFSLFTEIDLSCVKPEEQWPLLMHVFETLRAIHHSVSRASDIDACYELLPVELPPRGSGPAPAAPAAPVSEGSVLEALAPPAHAAWPILWGASEEELRIRLIGDARTPPEGVVDSWPHP